MSETSHVVTAIERLYAIARERVRARVVVNGKIAADKLDNEQLAAHAVAYLATELEAARQTKGWVARAESEGGGAHEQRIARAYVGASQKEFRKFTDREVVPIAQDVHRKP